MAVEERQLPRSHAFGVCSRGSSSPRSWRREMLVDGYTFDRADFHDHADGGVAATRASWMDPGGDVLDDPACLMQRQDPTRPARGPFAHRSRSADEVSAMLGGRENEPMHSRSDGP